MERVEDGDSSDSEEIQRGKASDSDDDGPAKIIDGSSSDADDTSVKVLD